MDSEQATQNRHVNSNAASKPVWHDATHVGRGFLMGGADIIPGVSGGTVALILGIYERLVTAISHVDLRLLGHLKRGEWRAFAEYLDLRFLIVLGLGILLGVGGLASAMHWLLEYQLQHTFSAFFGLILASSLLVGRMVEKWTPVVFGLLVIGTVVACLVVGMDALETPPEGNGYIFFCGCIAICAMILPGISGSFILLILGKYFEVTGLLKDLLKGHITVDAIITVAVFCSGCLIGLLSFAKTLRWLLARYESATMALLCGFMLGSLRKIWPFKVVENPEAELKHRTFDNVLPEFTGETAISIGLAIAAFAFVLLLDRLIQGHEHISPLKEEEPAL